MNRYFSKEYFTLTNGQQVYEKTPHQADANQTKMRYHLTAVGMAIIKKQKTSVGKVVEKMQPFYTVGGHVKWLLK